MQQKNSFIIAAIAVAIALFSAIFAVVSNAKLKSAIEDKSKVNSDYDQAKEKQAQAESKLLQLAAKVQALQDSQDSLRANESKYIKEIGVLKSNYILIKNALSKPTNYADSSNYSIIKNLPK